MTLFYLLVYRKNVSNELKILKKSYIFDFHLRRLYGPSEIMFGIFWHNNNKNFKAHLFFYGGRGYLDTYHKLSTKYAI